MPAVVTVAQVRARLNKTLTVDDAEIGEMIDAAEAEYASQVGPITTKTLSFDGGRSSLILPVNAATVTAVSYSDGTVVDVADLELDVDSGLLHWGYGTAGYFTFGARNVTVTFTVTVPANHKEAIIADVAGYFAATQRGGGGRGTAFPSEAAVDAYDAVGGPITLFPRIRGLAERTPSIA